MTEVAGVLDCDDCGASVASSDVVASLAHEGWRMETIHGEVKTYCRTCGPKHELAVRCRFAHKPRLAMSDEPATTVENLEAALTRSAIQTTDSGNTGVTGFQFSDDE